MVNDLDVLEIFLNDFFSSQLNVLIGFFPRALTNAINHVFFDKNADLFGQVRAGRQLRYTLADERAFRQVSLTNADHILIEGIASGALSVAHGTRARRRQPGMIVPVTQLLKRLLRMISNGLLISSQASPR